MSQVHVFFDFDDTLIRGDSILFWLRFYYRHKPWRRYFQILNWIGLLLFIFRLIDSHALKRIFLIPMAHEHPSVLDRMAEEFVRKDLARRFHPVVLRRLWVHHLLGHRVVIISASATFYLDHLKALLPMAEILGTEMLWPHAWWGLPQYRGGNLKGENKVVRLKNLGFVEHSPDSFAYSDSHHDAPLLGFTEHPVCVRPSRKLRKLALANRWLVLDAIDGISQVPNAADASSPAAADATTLEPRGTTGLKEKLGKLGLLLFAVGSEGEAKIDPLREIAAVEAARKTASKQETQGGAGAVKAYAAEAYTALQAQMGLNYDDDRNQTK